jgi:hypothetical protein
MKIPGAALIAILLTFVSVSAQRNNVIAAGDPPLTQSMVDRLSGLMEWSLDTELSQGERSALRTSIVGYWNNSDEKSIKSVVDILAFEQKLARSGDAQKRDLQPQIQASLLKVFEEDPNDPMNKVLLAAYRRSHSNSAGVGAAATGGGSPADLVGRWQVRRMNSVTTRNVYSGAIGDANGMIAEFDIKPNGQVMYSFYMSQVNYGCTTRIKTSKTGRAIVNGSRVTFSYDSGTTTSQDSCNAKYNYTKNLGRTSDVYDFGFKVENGKKHFCFADAKLSDCAVKVE